MAPSAPRPPQQQAPSGSPFPQPLTRFVGRKQEQAEIIQRLSNPGCRLLTLLGPGGIGKTRLAAQVAARLDDLPHGVHFVDLQHVRAAKLLAPAIADGLALPLSGDQAPVDQVRQYLSDKELLLVLDGFEHLLSGVDVLLSLLHGAPGAKFLVTSREALNLKEEYLYPLRGLPFPERIRDAGALAEYDAVTLFVERARQVRPGFSLANQANGLVHICRLVEGRPLAIELAASWVSMLDCEAIASEIQGSIDFLATRLRNVPDRHRSMRAVFDHTWTLLTEQERHTFERLSVFQGVFERQAAEYVSGASLHVLSALVDKSLLRLQPSGRYHIHGLLRQYAHQRLSDSPEALAQTYERHCECYTTLLADRLDDLKGGRQRKAIDEIAAAIENVRAAWDWMTAQARVEAIDRSVQALSIFYQYQSRYLEGANAMRAAIACLTACPPSQEVDLALLKSLLEQAWFAIRLGQLREAEQTLARCEDLYQRLSISPIPGVGTDPRLGRAFISLVRGDYAAAAHAGQGAYEASRAPNRPWNRQIACYVLARALLAQGQPTRARHYAEQAYATASGVHDNWFASYCLIVLGDVARASRDPAAAERHYRHSYAIRETFDDPEGMAVALHHLGKLALERQTADEALSLYSQSLEIYHDLNDRGRIATSLHGLGAAAVRLGDNETARQHLVRGLQIAADIKYTRLVLALLIGIGDLYRQIGRDEEALDLFARAQSHPASDQNTKSMAKQRLERRRSGLSPQQRDALIKRAKARDLEALVAHLEQALSVPLGADASSPDAPQAAPASEDQPLVEPLTPRELEVLVLIAAGMTNQQIADELVLSLGTVKWYTSQIYGKLNAQNRTHAAARAEELGLLA